MTNFEIGKTYTCKSMFFTTGYEATVISFDPETGVAIGRFTDNSVGRMPSENLVWVLKEDKSPK